jgi:hypothetical protein
MASAINRVDQSGVLSPSGLQLLDRQVGIAYSHAQFVPERGEQLDRDVGLVLAQGALALRLGMIFSENRCTLFRIMPVDWA